MEALPSDEQISNILADLTRVFVIEIRKQTTHASGASIVEEYNETIKWSLPKGVMVKIMKIVHMISNNKPNVVASRFICEVFLDDECHETDLGDDGVLDELNDLFLRCIYNSTSSLDMVPIERNWEPGKVLPKNEIQITLENSGTGTEAFEAILTAIVHIHYQLFRFDTTDADAMLWEKATTSD